MGDTVSIGTNWSLEREMLPAIEILDKPHIKIHDSAVLTVLAVAQGYTSIDESIPIGYVSTKSGNAQMLDEFSGEPTGEYESCNAVKGWIGEEAIYKKQITTDMPLSGLRTTLAKRRAVKRVKAHLK